MSASQTTDDGRERVYFSATAECEVQFPVGPARNDFFGEDVAAAQYVQFGPPMKVVFASAARGCAQTTLYDDDRNRKVYKLESLLTLFHADDARPEWMKALMDFTSNMRLASLPKPVNTLASKLLSKYGPGSITVIQDDNRPVYGEVVADAQGPDAPMFPAFSYFDQYLTVKVTGRTFTNKKPLRVSSRVNVWPPSGEIYRSEGVTPFYETNQYNDVPAFTFGKCTISILNQLTAEQVGDLRSMISVLRQ